MKSLAISYVVFLVIFVGVDFIWLSRAGDAMYRPTMGDMTLADFRLAPAVAFYLIYAVGAVFFAIAPALDTGDWMTAALARRSVRAMRLCHLRSDQSRHAEELVDHAVSRGHGLGLAADGVRVRLRLQDHVRIHLMNSPAGAARTC